MAQKGGNSSRKEKIEDRLRHAHDQVKFSLSSPYLKCLGFQSSVDLCANRVEEKRRSVSIIFIRTTGARVLGFQGSPGSWSHWNTRRQ